jgi:hypothetical protein
MLDYGLLEIAQVSPTRDPIRIAAGNQVYNENGGGSDWSARYREHASVAAVLQPYGDQGALRQAGLCSYVVRRQ